MKTRYVTIASIVVGLALVFTLVDVAVRRFLSTRRGPAPVADEGLAAKTRLPLRYAPGDEYALSYRTMYVASLEPGSPFPIQPHEVRCKLVFENVEATGGETRRAIRVSTKNVRVGIPPSDSEEENDDTESFTKYWKDFALVLPLDAQGNIDRAAPLKTKKRKGLVGEEEPGWYDLGYQDFVAPVLSCLLPDLPPKDMKLGQAWKVTTFVRTAPSPFGFGREESLLYGVYAAEGPVLRPDGGTSSEGDPAVSKLVFHAGNHNGSFSQVVYYDRKKQKVVSSSGHLRGWVPASLVLDRYCDVRITAIEKPNEWPPGPLW